jgi:Ca-activated chloride channel homolog
MDFNQFHFAQGAWLWGLLAIPAVPILYSLFYKSQSAGLLERFADRHLLPHLVKSRGVAGNNIRAPLFLWSAAWFCGVLAMAGPRWNYTDEQTFVGMQDLVIVLDLSQTMNAKDVKPSRMARAREEIEDLLDMNRGTSIGLVAYAAVPHMVTPLTDDVRTIKNLLPELNTSLVTIQGNRLKPALEMAAVMLKGEPGNDKSVLVIGNGNFQENDFAALAHAAGNAVIYTMGVGTASGAPVPGGDGDWLKDDDGKPQISRLQAARLRSLAAAGHGLYVEANYTNDDTRAILGRIAAARTRALTTQKTVRLWEERFYIPVLVLALLLLPLFRRGAVFPIVVLFSMAMFSSGHAEAMTFEDLFLNKNQQARAAYDRHDYKDAMAKFDTPYRRGVVAYRAGAYDKAAMLFKTAAAQTANLDAVYNLGNAQLMQYLPEDAIASYKAVLKKKPGDVPTLHNLAIAEKMLQQPPPQQKQKPPQNNKGGGGGGGGQNKQQQGQQQQGKGGQQSGQNQQGGAQNQSQAGKQGSQSKQQAEQAKGNQQAAQQQKGGQGQAQQQAAQQQAAQQARTQQGSPQAGKQTAAKMQAAHQTPGSGKNPGDATNHYMLVRGRDGAAPRTQLDVNADEWLNRVPSDPGSFLKNQFMIEDQKSGEKQGTP